MTPDEFWRLIEKSGEEADTCDDPVDTLVELLGSLAPAEIVAFNRHFGSLMRDSYRWDLWGAAYIINGGCSDDGFEYFRGWLVTQGREAWEAALKDPESRAARIKEEDLEDGLECEMMLGAAGDAYEESTGEEIPDHGQPYPKDPLGKRWEEEDLGARFPKLWKRFSGE